MVSVHLPSDALLQHLPSYLGFSYLGRWVSLHGCFSKVQPLLLTLEEWYLLETVPPDLERGVPPLGPPDPEQPLLLGHGVVPLGCCPNLGRGVASFGRCMPIQILGGHKKTKVKVVQACPSLSDPKDCEVKGFLCGLAGKESACNARDLSSIPQLSRSPEKE